MTSQLILGLSKLMRHNTWVPNGFWWIFLYMNNQKHGGSYIVQWLKTSFSFRECICVHSYNLYLSKKGFSPLPKLNIKVRHACSALKIHTHMWSFKKTPILKERESACNAGTSGDTSLIPGLGRSPGGGNGKPPQYSYLENPMDWEVYRLHTVHRVTKSRGMTEVT